MRNLTFDDIESTLYCFKFFIGKNVEDDGWRDSDIFDFFWVFRSLTNSRLTPLKELLIATYPKKDIEEINKWYHQWDEGKREIIQQVVAAITTPTSPPVVEALHQDIKEHLEREFKIFATSYEEIHDKDEFLESLERGAYFMKTVFGSHYSYKRLKRDFYRWRKERKVLKTEQQEVKVAI